MIDDRYVFIVVVFVVGGTHGGGIFAIHVFRYVKLQCYLYKYVVVKRTNAYCVYGRRSRQDAC